MPTKRKPTRKFPMKFEIRPVRMSDLEPDERAAVLAALAETKTVHYTEVHVPKQRGLKIKVAPQAMEGLKGIPAAHMTEILQHIINHTAAERRRKLTRPKLVRKAKKK